VLDGLQGLRRLRPKPLLLFPSIECPIIIPPTIAPPTPDQCVFGRHDARRQATHGRAE